MSVREEKESESKGKLKGRPTKGKYYTNQELHTYPPLVNPQWKDGEEELSIQSLQLT